MYKHGNRNITIQHLLHSVQILEAHLDSYERFSKLWTLIARIRKFADIFCGL